MKRLMFGFLVLALASPAMAKDRFFELIGRATWIDSTGDSLDFDQDADFGLEFDDEVGFGLAFNAYLTDRLSVEIGGTLIEPDFVLVVFEPDGPLSTQGLEMIAVTGALQFHLFGSGRFDPYVGVGGTYLIFDEVDTIVDITENDVEAIEFEDDVGWMVNAGLNIGLWERIALNLDVKYSRNVIDGLVTFDRGDFTSGRNVDFNPVLVSAGINWRF